MWGGREKEEKVCGVSSRRMVLPLPAAREERKDGDGGALQSEACEVPGASWTPQGDTEGLNVAESPGARG